MTPAIVCKTPNFYPRPPRGGRRIKTLPDMARKSKFLPTPSARRATDMWSNPFVLNENFYPRPPRGGRHVCHHVDVLHVSHFYPRPPRGGRRQDL